MDHPYRRRADFPDLPMEIRLGILQYERDLADEFGTPEEQVNARAAIKRLEETIEKLAVKPAPEGVSFWQRALTDRLHVK